MGTVRLRWRLVQALVPSPDQDLDELTDGKYFSDAVVEVCEKQKAWCHVDEFEGFAAVLEVAGKEYILSLELGKYGNKWYVLEQGGALGMMIGIPRTAGGLWPISELS